MSEQFEGAPLPYDTLEVGAHTASGGCQIYLTDVNGRKIGCVWGKANEKAFTAHLLATAASSHDDLVKALERMTQTFKPFTMRPIGGEGSSARIEQQDQVDAHAEAIKVLAAAKGTS